MSFMNTLTQRERQALRAIVKKVHLKHNPKEFVNDYEADKLIEAVGPESAQAMIKAGYKYLD
jgi:hypothetical protein